MEPPIDDTYLPCGWIRESADEDRIAFAREDSRLTLVAELVEEGEAIHRLSTGPVWRMRCEQRAGEAESGIPMGCVTTVNTAMETLLRYMRRISEISESEEGVSVGAILDQLGADLTSDHRDDWGRSRSNSLDARLPSP
ncbi:hypothetical protein [Halalkalicoccus subterraneus]|uniref:hypothetical protein n=1 Tax=Halalkalicoccus subterraneus TaxID=2675002 RepID=UPI000EFCBC26|nr:hypothetical protein [Halalkalicoccus subterraneus]